MKVFSCMFNFYRNCIKYLKTTQNKKKKHNKIVILVRSKLNSKIKTKISESLINNQISHEYFMLIINEEFIRIYKRLLGYILF